MKKSVIGIILGTVFTMPFFAQQGKVQGGPDVSNFPSVSVVWNEFGPSVLTKTNVSVTENGTPVFVDSVVPLETKVDSFERNLDILFLVENVSVRRAEFDLAHQLLFYLLPDIADSKDFHAYCNVATFNRASGLDSLLQMQFPDFTDDVDTKSKESVANNQLRELAHSTVQHNDPYKSDLVTAIDYGIRILAERPMAHSKTLVVYTSCDAYNLTSGEFYPIEEKAIQARIPVYIVLLRNDTQGIEPIRTFAERVNGGIFLAQNQERTVVNTALLEALAKTPAKVSGQNYRISFQSNQERKGQLCPIVITLGNRENSFYYHVPSFSLKVWIKDHLYLFIIILAVIVIVAGLGGFFGVRKLIKIIRHKKEEKEREVRIKEQLAREQSELKNKMSRAKQEMAMQREREAREEERRNKEEEQKKLTALMLAKNIQPRLVIGDLNNAEVYNINKATITIGSDLDNDFVIQKKTVSRKHAEIRFDGRGFYIVDMDSTNGTTLNGRQIKEADLKNGDTIGIADEIIKLYI